MNFLEQKIMEEGSVKQGNILKVDNFLNHQIDIDIMRQIAYEFKRRFRGKPVTKILTIEASGIAIGVLLGDLMCKLSGGKINPLIGSAGVSAVPMAARVSQKVGQQENPSNFLLMHAMGPNVAGVIGSAVAAGVFISMFG